MDSKEFDLEMNLQENWIANDKELHFYEVECLLEKMEWLACNRIEIVEWIQDWDSKKSTFRDCFWIWIDWNFLTLGN